MLIFKNDNPVLFFRMQFRKRTTEVFLSLQTNRPLVNIMIHLSQHLSKLGHILTHVVFTVSQEPQCARLGRVFTCSPIV